MQHDFFDANPIRGADVYWLRYIMYVYFVLSLALSVFLFCSSVRGFTYPGYRHDWSDDYCVRILSAIHSSMTLSSRILICDQVMNTTLGCPELDSAPPPLSANYGYYTRYSHQRDLAMMGIINGIERTPAQFRTIVEAAGLCVEKIWECRSQVSIVEVRLPAE
jgi:hypothetical protein